MTKHTEGKWYASPDDTENPGKYWIESTVPGQNLIGTIIGGKTQNELKANAHRIVACVNACEGISNKALEEGVVGEMLEALKFVFNEIFMVKDKKIAEEQTIFYIRKLAVLITKATEKNRCPCGIGPATHKHNKAEDKE